MAQRRNSNAVNMGRRNPQAARYAPLNLVPVPMPQGRQRNLTRRALHTIMAELKYHRARDELNKNELEIADAGNQLHAASLQRARKLIKLRIKKYAHFNTLRQEEVSEDEDDGTRENPENTDDLSEDIEEEEPTHNSFQGQSPSEVFNFEEDLADDPFNQTRPYESEESEDEPTQEFNEEDYEEMRRRPVDKTIPYTSDDEMND